MKPFVAVSLALAFATAALAQGPAPGGAAGKGPAWSFGASNTPGWSLMSAEEQVEHRNKMMSFQTMQECRLYVEGHHKLMQARAKEQGKSLAEAPRKQHVRAHEAGRTPWCKAP